jgi:hypothetical protein
MGRTGTSPNPRGKAGNAPEGYYTAKEAYTRLGMTAIMFHRNVGEKGLQIRRFVPVGAKEGFYSQEEIDLLASLRHKGLADNRGLGSTTFRAATATDVEGIIEVLATLGWEESQPDARLRASWYEANSEIDHVVLQGPIIMGYISGVPYTEDAMTRRLYGEIEAKDIRAEFIQPFTDGGVYDLFIGLVERKKPEGQHAQYARYGARLVLGFIRFLTEDLIERGIRIRYLLGHSAEYEGQAFAEAVGFEQRGAGKYPIYILDMETSMKGWVQRYRERWAAHEKAEAAAAEKRS